MNTTIKTLLAITAVMFTIGVGAQTTVTNDTNTNTMQASDTHAKPARSTGRYVSDKAISTKINAIFLTDTDLKSGGIRVRTYRGVVHLTGSAVSQDQIDLAVHRARAVTGVKAVRNNLEVVPGT